MGNVYVCDEYLSWLRFELLSRVRVPKTPTFIIRLSSKPLKVNFICRREKNSFLFALKQRRKATQKWPIYQGSFGLTEGGLVLRVGEQFSRAVINGGKFELSRLRQTANLRFKLRICQFSKINR